MGDFAIVTLNNDVTTTNRVYGGISITGTYSSLPEGTTIYKYGTVTKLSYGTITRSGDTAVMNYSVKISDNAQTYYYVRGLYESSMYNASGTDAILEGDSGGPVYVKNGSNYLLHGIVTAKDNNIGGLVTSVMYSSPIAYAEAEGFKVKID